MKRSAALRNTTLQFYDRFSASDLASFDAFVSKDAKLFSEASRVSRRRFWLVPSFRQEGGLWNLASCMLLFELGRRDACE
jgi:hypothetical protein